MKSTVPPPVKSSRDQQVEQDRTPLVLRDQSELARKAALVSHEVVVNLIGATTTRTRLRVQSQLDTNPIPGRAHRIADDELEAIYLRRHSFHGEWNYPSLLPRVALLN